MLLTEDKAQPPINYTDLICQFALEKNIVGLQQLVRQGISINIQSIDMAAVTKLAANNHIEAAMFLVSQFKQEVDINQFMLGLGIAGRTEFHQADMLKKIIREFTPANDFDTHIPLLERYFIFGYVRSKRFDATAMKLKTPIHRLTGVIRGLGYIGNNKEALDIISQHPRHNDPFIEHLIKGLAEGGYVDKANELINSAPARKKNELKCWMIEYLTKAGFFQAASEQILLTTNLDERHRQHIYFIDELIKKRHGNYYIQLHIAADNKPHILKKILFQNQLRDCQIDAALSSISYVDDQIKKSYWEAVPSNIAQIKGYLYNEHWVAKIVMQCPCNRIATDIRTNKNINITELNKLLLKINWIMIKYSIKDVRQAFILLDNFKVITQIFFQLFRKDSNVILGNVSFPQEIILEFAAFALDLPTKETNHLMELVKYKIINNGSRFTYATGMTMFSATAETINSDSQPFQSMKL